MKLTNWSALSCRLIDSSFSLQSSRSCLSETLMSSSSTLLRVPPRNNDKRVGFSLRSIG